MNRNINTKSKYISLSYCRRIRLAHFTSVAQRNVTAIRAADSAAPKPSLIGNTAAYQQIHYFVSPKMYQKRVIPRVVSSCGTLNLSLRG